MAWHDKLYYFEADIGCGLRRLHVDRNKAITQIRREVGEENLKLLRKATKEDIDWITAMGGCLG